MKVYSSIFNIFKIDWVQFGSWKEWTSPFLKGFTTMNIKWTEVLCPWTAGLVYTSIVPNIILALHSHFELAFFWLRALGVRAFILS